jgi:hypothetical protein
MNIKGLFNRRSLGRSAVITAIITAFAAGPALAATKPTSAVDTSACSTPALAQPFLSANDTNWYTLAPGETADNFDGTGWTLTGGARIITTRLADGQTGSVLDLPSGSMAVSPSICVESDYPTARTVVKDAPGAQIGYSVAYAGTLSAVVPEPAGFIVGTAPGWSLSNPFQVHPGNAAGWQLVRFTFVSFGLLSNAQMYNFYIDPRMAG